MKLRMLFTIVLVIMLAFSCSKNSTGSEDKYSISDLVGTWVGTAVKYILTNDLDLVKITFTLELTVDASGNVTGSGVSSQWDIDKKGEVTGEGSVSLVSGSIYISANGSWLLIMNSGKDTLLGSLDVTHPDYHDMNVSLTKNDE